MKLKTPEEIVNAINGLDDKPNLSGMTYKEGLDDALRWMLGDIEDDEFYPLDGE